MNIFQQPRGIKDVLLSNATGADTYQKKGQGSFKKFYDFCERMVSLNIAERVSLYYGNGGTGVDFWDGPNPFRRNAFFVYQWKPTKSRRYSFYVHAQYSDDATFGTDPGTLALIRGSNGSASQSALGVQIALAVDVDGNDVSPWNGTTNFDGSDTKGTPVWEAPAGGSVHVWPRSNNTGGSHATNRENMIEIFNQPNTTDHRLDFSSNGEALSIIYNFDNTANIYDIFLASPYRPRLDIVEAENSRPFFVYHAFDRRLDGVGDLAGTSFNNGGVLWDHTDQVRSVDMLVYNSAVLYGSSNFGDQQGEIVAPYRVFTQEAGIGLVGLTYSSLWGYLLDDNFGGSTEVAPATPPYFNRSYDNGGIEPYTSCVMWAGGSNIPKSSNTRDGEII